MPPGGKDWVGPIPGAQHNSRHGRKLLKEERQEGREEWEEAGGREGRREGEEGIGRQIGNVMCVLSVSSSNPGI